MIHSGFYCEKDHEFDEWFDSIADYERKAVAGEIACPDCGSHEVTKALAAPNVGRSTPRTGSRLRHGRPRLRQLRLRGELKDGRPTPQ